MRCNVCNKEEASIHLTEIVNDKMVEMHMCEQCAREKGAEAHPTFSFGDLLAGLADFTPSTVSTVKVPRRCAACGHTITDFGKSGRLGCPDCYVQLARALAPVIKRVQRSDSHVGKRPSSLEPKIEHEMAMRQLEDKLRRYVQEENYEGAALVRDEIRKLEMNKSTPDKKPVPRTQSKKKEKDGS